MQVCTSINLYIARYVIYGTRYRVNTTLQWLSGFRACGVCALESSSYYKYKKQLEIEEVNREPGQKVHEQG